MNQSKVLQPHLLMIVWSVLIATSFPAANLVASKIDATSLTALRFLCASVLFFPFILKAGETNLPKKKEFIAYSVLASCIVFYFWGMFKALETTTPLNTGAIFTLIPALTAIIAYLLSRVTVGFRIFMALVVGGVGSLLVIIEGDLQILLSLQLNEGDVIFLIGCIVLAFYSPLIMVFRNRATEYRSPAYITFWVMTLGTLFLLIIAMIEQQGNLDWNKLNMFDYGVVLYLAVFTTVITFWQIQYCTPILGSTVVMSYTYLVPSMVLLIESVFFDLVFQNAIYLGVGLTLLSLLILNLDLKKIKVVQHYLANGKTV